MMNYHIGMERLSALLFELSNEDRLRILLQLKERPLKLSNLAQVLDFTVQETSRNVSRLSTKHLIQRERSGVFQLTPYGEQALLLLPGFEFLSKHPAYFTTHTLSRLPHGFVGRIGDLVNCTYIGDVMLTFYEAETMMQQSQESLWLISDQHLISSTPHLTNALQRGVQLRLILPIDLQYPSGYYEQDSVKELEKIIPSSKRSGLYEERRVDTVDACMGIADHASGRIFFPTLEGDFDYKGFTVTDERSHIFCRDLFTYYWNQATVMP
jgi:predicted transcriptional regulator